MAELLFDQFRSESQFTEDGRSRRTAAMRRPIARKAHHSKRLLQGGVGHRPVARVTVRKQVQPFSRDKSQTLQQVDGLMRQRDDVMLPALHTSRRDSPQQ